ncbi:MAG: hypothetical protein HY867_17810 [Chloroflexi bacterium]|nr:hypothetical protein [Chloroflexota bacterium]
MNIQRIASRIAVILVVAALLMPQTASAAPELAQSTYVNFWIDQVKILKSTGDFMGSGEFRILAVSGDKNGRSTAQVCPAYAPVTIQVGTVISSNSNLCSAGMVFKEEEYKDGIVIMVLGVDEDESTEIADLGVGVLSNGIASGIKGALVAKKIITTSSGPLGIGVDLLVGFITGKALDWIEESDVLGSAGIYLTKSDGWGVTNRKTIKTPDGGLEIVYSVNVSQTPGSKPPPTTGSTNPPVTGGITSCPGAKPFTVKVGDKGYVCTKYDRLIVRYTASMSGSEMLALYPGAEFTIIEGPRCADNFTWWKISIPAGTKYSCSTCARESYGYTTETKTGWVREGWDTKDTYFICKR